MKLVIAADSFKDCLSAEAVCRTIGDAIRTVRPDARIVLMPMADGGEGTAKAMMAAKDGVWIDREVTGPLSDMKVKAGFVWFADTRSALVEMATASGLELLKPHQRNPMLTSTLGTGQLIHAAVDYGARHILLTAGGSATVDLGIGMATVLGWRFLDAAGRPVVPAGGQLIRIARIVAPDRPWDLRVELLSDVTNPLVGPNGAAPVFGPQKGASPDQVAELADGLRHVADLMERQLGVRVHEMPGGGCAGGLGAAAVVFLKARIVSGIQTIIREFGLQEAVRDADWVITGEGSFDSQSLHGKVVSGILEACRGSRAKIAVFAGRVGLTPDQARGAGIESVVAVTPAGTPLETALAQGRQFMAAAAREWAMQHLSEE